MRTRAAGQGGGAAAPDPGGGPQIGGDADRDAIGRAVAARYGLGYAARSELAAADRMITVAGVEGAAFVELGRCASGPIVAVPADPASIARIAGLVLRQPEARARIRLADPAAVAATLRRLGLRPPPPVARVTAVPEDGIAAVLAACRAGAAGLLADRVMTRGQRRVALAAGLLAAAAFALAPGTALAAAAVAAAVAFLALAVVRAAAAFGPSAGFAPPRRRLEDAALPVYSILVPLLREERIVDRLVAGLRNLDYPPEKLDVKLLVEAGDTGTRAALERATAGTGFEVLVLPAVGPLTKPKALDAGLVLARGDYVTVYDAEDRPDPSQLRHAAEVFAADPRLACVQARLAIDHADDCWLTRMFALEYAGLFDRLLPWFAAHRLPFLLGGTSNHFRRADLVRFGGWDAWNVTEDADLALRIARRGGGSTVIPSTTWEEAPLTWRAWVNQRSRWQKGWIQTWLVHMRDPAGFWHGCGARGFVVLQLQLLAALAAIATHPLLCLLLLGYATGLLAPDLGGGFAGDMRVSLLALSLAGGYAAAFALALAGARSRRLTIGVLGVAGLPLYWLMLAAALGLALWDLWRRPHFWAKTEHGIARRRRLSATARAEGRDGGGDAAGEGDGARADAA